MQLFCNPWGWNRSGGKHGVQLGGGDGAAGVGEVGINVKGGFDRGVTDKAHGLHRVKSRLPTHRDIVMAKGVRGEKGRAGVPRIAGRVFVFARRRDHARGGHVRDP